MHKKLVVCFILIFILLIGFLSAAPLDNVNKRLGKILGKINLVEKPEKIESDLVKLNSGSSSGNIQITSADIPTTKTYIYAGILLASKVEGEDTQYYIQDHLGSNKKVVNGQVEIQENDFYAFGEDKLSSGSEEDYLYTGKEKDSDTELYYYGARYYSPELGRFTQPDILTGDISKPLSMNRYAYVENNPLKYVDPTGNKEVKGSATYSSIFASQFNRGQSLAWGGTVEVTDFGLGEKTEAKLDMDFFTGGDSPMEEAIHPVAGTFSLSLSGEITDNIDWQLEHTSTNSIAQGVKDELVGPMDHSYILGQENQLVLTSNKENIETSVGVGQIDSYGSANSLLNLDSPPILLSTENNDNYEGVLLRTKANFPGGGAISLGTILTPKGDDVKAMGFSTSPSKIPFTSEGNVKYSVSGTFVSSGDDANYGISLNLNF